MINLNQIHPVTDFVRNYKTFLGRIKETGQPEVLTVNGKPEYVILDASSYQEVAEEIERRRFIRAVNEGIEDMRAGRGMPAEDAFMQIRSDQDERPERFAWKPGDVSFLSDEAVAEAQARARDDVRQSTVPVPNSETQG